MTFSICQMALLESGRESTLKARLAREKQKTDPVTIGECLVVLSKETISLWITSAYHPLTYEIEPT
jgi:hypothetical protein